MIRTVSLPAIGPSSRSKLTHLHHGPRIQNPCHSLQNRPARRYCFLRPLSNPSSPMEHRTRKEHPGPATRIPQPRVGLDRLVQLPLGRLDRLNLLDLLNRLNLLGFVDRLDRHGSFERIGALEPRRLGGRSEPLSSGYRLEPSSRTARMDPGDRLERSERPVSLDRLDPTHLPAHPDQLGRSDRFHRTDLLQRLDLLHRRSQIDQSACQ